ncbi:hypothetical protein B0H10DRAFT_1960771 [Mycena sp. CBHHK59/15]|nr:hypothetical protein B0H10DRAFT_1960771 [Mycena sp. CBHHK59/15]
MQEHNFVVIEAGISWYAVKVVDSEDTKGKKCTMNCWEVFCDMQCVYLLKNASARRGQSEFQWIWAEFCLGSLESYQVNSLPEDNQMVNALLSVALGKNVWGNTLIVKNGPGTINTSILKENLAKNSVNPPVLHRIIEHPRASNSGSTPQSKPSIPPHCQCAMLVNPQAKHHFSGQASPQALNHHRVFWWRVTAPGKGEVLTSDATNAAEGSACNTCCAQP